MITEDYVSFETAKLLKEKGFNESTDKQFNLDKIVGDYNITDRSRNPERYLDAPTLQMAMKWLREVHMLHVDVDPSEGDWNPTVITLEDWTCAEKFGDNIPIQDTYEEACEAAIKYCLEKLI